MHPAGDFPFLAGLCHPAVLFAWTGSGRLFADLFGYDIDQLVRGFQASMDLVESNSTLDLIIAIISFICTVALFLRFNRRHRKKTNPSGRRVRRRNKWVNWQVNLFMIPLVICVTFTVIYFMFR